MMAEASEMEIHGKDDLLTLLREKKEELRNFGVRRIGFFGSFSRDESDEDSDVDIVVEFERGSASFRSISALIDYLENLLNRPVDLLTPSGIESIRPDEVRERIEKEVVYV